MLRISLKPILTSLAFATSLSSAVFAQGFAGPYLAARSANIANDYSDAARYYAEALASQPDNGFLMQGALFANIAIGDFDAAKLVAQNMVDHAFTDAYAQTVLISAAFAAGDYAQAQALLDDETFDLNPLVKTLVTGWILVAEGQNTDAAIYFPANGENDAIAAFANYHNALALALTGDLASAEDILANNGAYVNRVSILAHAEILSVLGRSEDAFHLMTVGPGGGLGDRESDNIRQRLDAGETLSFTQIDQPSDAVSEVFLTLGDALDSDNSPRLALFFSRLAQQNQPSNSEALLLIAAVLSGQDQQSLAIAAYEKVASGDPFSVNASIGLAGAYQDDGRVDQAISVLENLSETHPDDLTVWNALADIYRRESRYADARDAYSGAIDLLPDPNVPGAWRLYYTRAIVEERLKEWPDADRDFRQALALNPDQPDVLNYLGYSLVERGEKLDEALQMIETAVAARPQSGFIADSLGWIYYRLGRFDEAVPVMENAAALMPVDAVVNDHLGDVLWMVGRKREARFQWRRALSFDPDEIDLERIRDKLANGLDAVLEAETGAQSN
ncbi:MAG: tetratricopeptide repeat protein [Rhodobacteraceae bacterium]|nr:tetratricopeptide repeat protein [Paracoccaceae bacterium]